MRENRWGKMNNKGASLIAVLIAIVVVGVMGSVVMQLTITNLQMKEVERQGKQNFYSAEDFMGYFTNQINVKTAKQLQGAFNDMLAMYKTVSQTGGGLKTAFSKAYLDRLVETFGVDTPTPNQKKNVEEVLYQIGYYDVSLLESLVYSSGIDGDVNDVVPTDLQDTTKYGFSYTPYSATLPNLSTDGFYYADYEKGTFTLGNICVFAKDDFGNVTRIKTDLVFITPDVNLDGSNVVKEFMRYSLIADREIEVNSTLVKVDGNVYAGKDGIKFDLGNSGKFIGKKIVTRGDIAVSAGGNAQIGNPDNSAYTQIWANNYKTLNDGSAGAKLYISGDSYIADDLSVDGNDSEVVISGAYYGYNFQENYDVAMSTPPENSAFSSAIMINGKNAMVDVNDITSFMVYGRSFIGRNKNVSSGSNDIMMGEAISVKSNQIAYYVPSDCVDKSSGVAVLITDLYENYSGVMDIDTYVSGTGVTEYHYMEGSTEKTVYYLKFKSEQAANDFYYAYFTSKQISMMQKAEKYISPSARSVVVTKDDGTTETVNHYSLQINSARTVMRGDYIYRDAAGQLATAKWSIPGGYWGKGQTYFEFAKDHAIRYKSLALTLEDKNDASMAGNVRIQPTDTTMFHVLIDDAQWAGFFIDHDSEITDGKFVKPWKENEADPTTDILLAIVDNAGGDPYQIPDGYTRGLIIASGDVHVNKDFRGTIISGNLIKLDHSGVTVESDEVLISKMISQDAMLKSNALFSKLFKDYSSSASSVMSGSSIDKYMSYDNWTKTVE